MQTTKFMLEVEPEQVDAIVLQSLNEALEMMEKDFEDRVDNDSQLGIFSNDRLEDITRIQSHIDAFKKVISYYGGNETLF